MVHLARGLKLPERLGSWLLELLYRVWVCEPPKWIAAERWHTEVVLFLLNTSVNAMLAWLMVLIARAYGSHEYVAGYGITAVPIQQRFIRLGT